MSLKPNVTVTLLSTDVRCMQLLDCQDDMHDECPEYHMSILKPGTMYVCDCSCHE